MVALSSFLFFFCPFLGSLALSTEDEIAILRSEVKSFRSELKAFKLEAKLPEQARENEEVLLHWLKRNVMDLRRELGSLESQRDQEAQGSLRVKEEIQDELHRNVESLWTELKEMRRNEEELKSLGKDIQSNIQFYNRLMSPEIQLLDSEIHIRSKKQMSKELKRMIAVINAFFKRLSNLEVHHGEMEKSLTNKDLRCEERLQALEKRFFDQVTSLKNVSHEAFASINALDTEVNGKVSQSLVSLKNLSTKTDKALANITSRQNNLETSMGEILRKINYLFDAQKYHEKESSKFQDSS